MCPVLLRLDRQLQEYISLTAVPVNPCEAENQVQSFAVEQLLQLTSIFTGVVD